MFLKTLSAIGVGLLVLGCSAKAPLQSQELHTIYDYQLLDQNYKPISLDTLTQSVKGYDVVFIGEFHGNQASHLLEAQLFASLQQQSKKDLVLSLEMFTRDEQKMVDEYLQSKFGEVYLVEETPAWKGYTGKYRPVVEYAKEHNLSVVAANASGDIVRCIGRQGEAYFEKLDEQEKGYVAHKPFVEVDGYREKYFSFMGEGNHMPKNRLQNSYLAQLTRDNTMAQSIAEAFEKRPNAQVVHLNGNFHSEEHLGTVGALKNINPKLSSVVITPIHVNELNTSVVSKADTYYYLIKSQPEQFISEEYQSKVFMEKFKESREKAKSCK